MSRAHAIYNQSAIKPTEAKLSTWPSAWNPEAWIKPHSGAIVEGKVLGRYRHTIKDSAGANFRFTILTVELGPIFKREYDAEGKEVAINQGKTKRVQTGFLNTSFKDVEIEKGGKVDVEEFKRLYGQSPLKSLGQQATGNTFEFWGEEDALDRIEFFQGESIRLKTRGETPLVDFISKLDDKSATISNFAGDQASGSWTDKLITKGKNSPLEVLPQDKLQGADDSEWD